VLSVFQEFFLSFSMPIEENLKKAIVQMAVREKDKLLLRLIAKDKVLTDKLYFELIEESETTLERREDLHNRISKAAQAKETSAGWLMMEMRSLSGEITYHVKITKDKYGEAELNLLLINEFCRKNQYTLLERHTSRNDKCAQYMAKKGVSIMKMVTKLPEDFHVDFAASVNEMLDFQHRLCTKAYARELGLPTEWP
jgi:hypothetical protein